MEAVLWGSVAASFVIEQDGLPSLAHHEGEGGQEGKEEEEREELWNGEKALDRVAEMKARMG